MLRVATGSYRAEAALKRPGVTDQRALQLHATVLSSSGFAGSGTHRKHTAKFEPDAWSWAQLTSGFGHGAPKAKRIFDFVFERGAPFTFKTL